MVSQLGDWVGRLAVLQRIGDLSAGGARSATGELAATAAADARLGIGILFALELALRMLPSVALGPLAGPLADRLPRRALMIASDLGRALLVLGIVFVDEPSELPLLYALVVGQMGLSVFFEAARSASVPNTLAKEDLQSGYALSAATWSTMLALGGWIGGALVARFGVDRVLQIDAATYVASALLLRGLALPPVPHHPQRFRVRDVATLLDLRRAQQHARERGVAPAVWAKAFWGGAGGILVLIPLAAAVRFGDGTGAVTGGAVAAAAGKLFLARGLGTGLGPVLGRALFPGTERSLRRQVGAGFLIAALTFLPFAVADSLALAFLWMFVSHIGGSMIWVPSTVLWQLGSLDPFRGRLSALERAGFTFSMTIVGLALGALYDATGDLALISALTSATILVGGTAWALWSARELRRRGQSTRSRNTTGS